MACHSLKRGERKHIMYLRTHAMVEKLNLGPKQTPFDTLVIQVILYEVEVWKEFEKSPSH